MGVERDSGREPRSDAVCLAFGLISKGNGEVILSKETHTSLSTGGGQAGQGYPAVLTVCYGISPFDSNAMKSDNPHAGIYVAETARTLDFNGGNPACNQGGVLVLQSFAVDCRNGTENECINGTLQGGTGVNFQIVVRVVYSS